MIEEQDWQADYRAVWEQSERERQEARDTYELEVAIAKARLEFTLKGINNRDMLRNKQIQDAQEKEKNKEAVKNDKPR